MKISEFKDKYIFQTKIDLGDGEYITLREPSAAEMADFTEDGVKNMKVLEKVFPKCVVSSSFINDDGKEASGTEVYNALKDSGSLFTEILGNWIQSIPMQSRLKPTK